MKIKNYELQGLAEFLYEMSISDSKASRMRTRMYRLILEKYQVFEQDRIQLLEQHAVKDKDKNSVKEDKGNGLLEYILEDHQKFQDDYIVLKVEYVIIDETEERKEMLISVRDSLLNVQGIELKGDKAVQYDRLCEIFEEIK